MAIKQGSACRIDKARETGIIQAVCTLYLSTIKHWFALRIREAGYVNRQPMTLPREPFSFSCTI